MFCCAVNPANELVDLINENRTAAKLPPLNNNPGIGCMALQFVEACKGNCNANNTLHCAPSEDDLTEIFAPNCGVELPTFGSITGRILGCHHKHLNPSEIFLQAIATVKNGTSLLKNKTNTEVGVGLMNSHKGMLYWCILFSSDRANSTFVLEDRGVGIKQKTGCFSGSSISCNYGQRNTNYTGAHVFLMICTWAFTLLLIRWLQSMWWHDYGTTRIPNARFSFSGRNKSYQSWWFFICVLLAYNVVKGSLLKGMRKITQNLQLCLLLNDIEKTNKAKKKWCDESLWFYFRYLALNFYFIFM